ncbi:MAG: creatininase family protein [Methanomassiliicoccaceae archaeon]|nr:creatininase family protein [Methanomassiliicoccaceae archaeon]
MDRITSPEFESTAANGPLVILPIGATESHGIHLPLGTDTFQAEYVAGEIEKRMNNVIVAPTLPYGNHSSLKNVPGTVNVSFDALRSFMSDVLISLASHGIKRMLIITGHAGTSHMAAVTEACRDVVSRKDVKIMFVSDYIIAAECEEFRFEGDGHGGIIETSRMLDIGPAIVKKERPSGKFADSSGIILKDASSCIPDGIVGDTSKADAELGEKINNYIVGELIRRINEVLS